MMHLLISARTCTGYAAQPFRRIIRVSVYRLCSAAFSPDHTRLCAAFEDASIRLWNLTSTSGDDDADSQSASSVTSAVPSSSSTILHHGSSADISQSRLSTHATDSGVDGGSASASTASSRDASFYPDVNISQVHLAGDFPDDVQQKNRSDFIVFYLN